MEYGTICIYAMNDGEGGNFTFKAVEKVFLDILRHNESGYSVSVYDML